jgi:serine protease Do
MMNTFKLLLIALLCLHVINPIQTSWARPIELDAQCQNTGVRTPALEAIYKSKRSAVVKLELENGVGTAFLVSTDGLALTAAHVVRAQQHIKAKLSDRSRHDVKLIALHPKLDLALIQLETHQSLKFLQFESKQSRAGQAVLSIGNSCNNFLAARYGKLLEVKTRPWQGLEGGLVRLGLPLAPGDSGAPVLNTQGHVIGVVRAGGDDGRGFAGFAIPSKNMTDWVKRVSTAFNR